MKIVYNIAGTYRPAGMERVLANKVCWLSAHGYEILIVTTDQRGRKPFFELPDGVRTVDLGIDYETNNGGSFLNKLVKYPFKQIKHRKALKRLLFKERPDITVSMFCNDAGFLPKIKDGSKKVLEIHFSKFKRIQYGRKGLWHLADVYRSHKDEKDVRRFDKFVVLTHEDADYWGALPNIRVIPNACTFSPSKRAALDSHKVIAISRLSYQKGYDMLIEAWNLVKKNPVSKDWTLEIVGDGELKYFIKNQVQDLGLEDSVKLLPPTNDVESVYMGASFLVLSSRYEGLPMVLLESQAFGVPAVSFECKCGPKDVIRNGVNGLLARDGDIEDLADKMIMAMADPDLLKRMGQAAAAMSADFKEENIMSRWDSLFKGLAK